MQWEWGLKTFAAKQYPPGIMLYFVMEAPDIHINNNHKPLPGSYTFLHVLSQRCDSDEIFSWEYFLLETTVFGSAKCKCLSDWCHLN